MSYVRPLGPIAPNAGAYEVFSCPNCAYAQIQVQNGAIDYSIAQGDSTMQSTFSVPDDTLLPGSGPILGPLQAIRFKARTPVSNPAPQISIRAEKALPLGASIAPSWAPSYATIAADGSIGANFSGHVHAQGLDLDSGSTSTPPDADRIRWLLPDGTTVSADEYSSSLASGNDNLSLRALATAASRSANLFLVAQNTLSGTPGSTVLTLTRSQSSSLISLDAGAQHKMLLNGVGQSDFQYAWGPWTALALNATNWQNQPGGQPAQYRIAPSPSTAPAQEIELRGDVQSITAIALGFAATGRIASLLPGMVPGADQVRIAPGTDPGAGNVVWGLDVTNAGVLYVFREHTGRALTLAAGVVVDIGMTYSTE